MEKPNSSTEGRQTLKKFFPHLRKSYSAMKNVLTLSKIETDKNQILRDIPNQKALTVEPMMSLFSKHSFSGISSSYQPQQQIQRNNSRVSDLILERSKSIGLSQHRSCSINNLIPSQKDVGGEKQVNFNFEKAKVSSKSIGYIKGYSVNSNAGPLNVINEDRICVVTNLNKSSIKQEQISFFSVYNGSNGVEKAEFFRDNFHMILSKDKQFWKDIENAIKRAIITVEENFVKQGQHCEASNTDVLFVLIINDSAYITSVGHNKMVVSSDFGARITNPFFERRNRKKSFGFGKQQKDNKKIAEVFKVSLQNIDFMVLGSEGLFENYNQKNIGLRIWKYFFLKKTDNFHATLGEISNSLLNDIFQQSSTKNVSVILIAFANKLDCFEPDKVQLPFGESSNEEIKEQGYF